MLHGMQVGLGPGDYVGWEASSPPEKGAAPSQFLAHVNCGQTAGWIMMPLGTEVNLGPCDVVLDGVAAPPRKFFFGGEGGYATFFGGDWVSSENKVPWAEPYIYTKWHLDASNRLVTMEMGRKLETGLRPLLGRGLGPHVTQSRLG